MKEKDKIFIVSYDIIEKGEKKLMGIKIIAKDEKTAVKRIEQIMNNCKYVYSAVPK